MATIQGQCAKCHLYFDIRNGLQCPHCKNQMAPVPHVSNADGTACGEDCPACIWFHEQEQLKEATPAVAWLERLYSLEDNR